MFKTLFFNFLNNQCSKIQKLAERKTNIKLTLIKAYAIIAVVCSHCSGGGIAFPMINWLYPSFFFMPLFIFTSGYFYHEKTDSAKIFPFLKNKILTLVVPYFGWNLVYGLLNHLFRSADVIHYGDPINFHSLFVRPWIDGHQYHFNIPSWFLLSLFIISVAMFFLRKLLQKLHILNDTALLLFTFAVSLGCIHLAQKGYNTGFGLCFLRAGFMLPYFQLGYFYKKHENFFTRRKALLIGVLFAAMFLAWVCAGGEDVWPTVVWANFTGDPFIITILTICGILLTATVCDILSPAFENSTIVRRIGDHTFTIMMHHGFIIFLINFAIYLLNCFTKVNTFDLTKFQSTLWYACTWKDARILIVYATLGVFIPLIMKLCYNRLLLFFHRKITSNRQNQGEPL